MCLLVLPLMQPHPPRLHQRRLNIRYERSFQAASRGAEYRVSVTPSRTRVRRVRRWYHRVLVLRGVGDLAGAGTGTRPGRQTAVTLAAKILGSGNLVGPYPDLCITIHRGHMLCPTDRGHRRLSAPSGSLGRTLFEILYMDFREYPFYDVG